MIIESIRIEEGVFQRFEQFSPHVNLIHSEKNSVGKTTFLRAILYSLGFNIPNTKNIRFEACHVSTILVTDNGVRIKLTRANEKVLILESNNTAKTYVLPSQQRDLHSFLFNTNNEDLLNSLLACIYVDQEKGWTLLNRGIAIGSIHFSIEELLRGLAGLDCKNLLVEREKVKNALNKYHQMASIAQYQDAVLSAEGSLSKDSYEETINVEMESLLIRQKELKKELERIDKSIQENDFFRKYIADMKLRIRMPDGDVMLVTEDSFVDLADTIDFLAAKRNITAIEYQKNADSLEHLKTQSDREAEQISFLKSEDLAKSFDRSISSIPINAIAIEQKIRQLDGQLKQLNSQISDKTRNGNKAIDAMYDTIIKYASELDLGDEESISTKYLFTSNLRELSGATLHKTVFAFRLAYIIELQKILKIKLPILLDSPRGKEVDEENTRKMMRILKRDFSDNQIIIASIYDYEFDDLHKIEIKQHLIDSPISGNNK